MDHLHRFSRGAGPRSQGTQPSMQPPRPPPSPSKGGAINYLLLRYQDPALEQRLYGGPAWFWFDRAAIRYHLGCIVALLCNHLYVKYMGSGNSCLDAVLWIWLLTLVAMALQAWAQYYKYRTAICIFMRLLFGLLHCPNMALCELKQEGIATMWPMRLASHLLTGSGWSSVVWYVSLFPLPFRHHAVSVVLMMILCLPNCSRITCNSVLRQGKVLQELTAFWARWVAPLQRLLLGPGRHLLPHNPATYLDVPLKTFLLPSPGCATGDAGNPWCRLQQLLWHVPLYKEGFLTQQQAAGGHQPPLPALPALWGECIPGDHTNATTTTTTSSSSSSSNTGSAPSWSCLPQVAPGRCTSAGGEAAGACALEPGSGVLHLPPHPDLLQCTLLLRAASVVSLLLIMLVGQYLWELRSRKRLLADLERSGTLAALVSSPGDDTAGDPPDLLWARQDRGVPASSTQQQQQQQQQQGGHQDPVDLSKWGWGRWHAGGSSSKEAASSSSSSKGSGAPTSSRSAGVDAALQQLRARRMQAAAAAAQVPAASGSGSSSCAGLQPHAPGVGVGSSAPQVKHVCSEIEPEECAGPQGEEGDRPPADQLSAGQVMRQLSVLPGWRWCTVRVVLLSGWVVLGVTAWGAQLLLDKLWG